MMNDYTILTWVLLRLFLVLFMLGLQFQGYQMANIRMVQMIFLLC